MAEEHPSPRIRKLREQKQRHRERSKIVRVGIAAVGFVLVLGGIVLSLPLVPGPGFVVIAVGLGLLALEFDVAERLLEKVVERLEDVGEQAAKLSLVQKSLIGVAVAVGIAAFVTAAVLWDLPVLPV